MKTIKILEGKIPELYYFQIHIEIFNIKFIFLSKKE